MTEVHRNTRRVLDAAAEHGLHLEVTRFPQGTRTAADAATAIGCEEAAIVKSIVLASDDGPVLVLTSGANRVDYRKVEAALGVNGVRRADADEVRAVTGFPIGGSAPLGLANPAPVLLDRDLMEHETVWAAAGTPDTVFPITPHDLERVSGAEPADVSE